MKSHKQLPKFIINNFKNKDDRVFYYDFKADTIKECSPRTLGTEDNYFSEETEEKLNKEVETSFSTLINKIKKRDFDKLTITESDDNVAIKYLDCSMMRSNFAYDVFVYNSYVARFFPKQDINNFLVENNLNNKDNKTISYLKDRVINVIVNNSKQSFITSRNGYAIISINKIECVIIPFDPFLAILLVPSDYPDKHKILLNNDEDEIKLINEQIASNEYTYNRDFIISIDKNELLRLQNVIEYKKECLNNIRNEVLLE